MMALARAGFKVMAISTFYRIGMTVRTVKEASLCS